MNLTNAEFRDALKVLERHVGKKPYFVYVLENRLNGRRYYGMTKDLLKRWESHRMDLLAGRHNNKYMQQDFEEQKELNYKMKVISVCFSKEEASTIEKELIIEDDNCYNMMNAGEGRPRKYSKKQIEHAIQLKEKYTYREVEEMTGISKSTLIRARRERGLI